MDEYEDITDLIRNDSQFIEYLYNRAYALLYLLRLKEGNKEKQLEEKGDLDE